jgi:hypothetical protein
MAMGFTIKSNEVPIGVYDAKFVGIERTTHPEFGDGLRFEWCITGGKCDGKSAYRTTGTTPTPRNGAGKMLAALAGATATDGLAIDADEFIGRLYTVVVEATESGSTRVGSAILKEDAPMF